MNKYSNIITHFSKWKTICKGFVTTLILCVSLGHSTPSYALIAETASASFLLNQFRASLSSLIKQAETSGDFLVWRAAIQARGLLDEWEKSNKKIISTAFKELNGTSQDVFRQIDKTVTLLQIEKNTTINQIENLTTIFAQMMSELVIADSDPYITSYQPRIIVPQGEQSVNLLISGPNLSEASPRLQLNDKNISMETSKQYELISAIERSEFPFRHNKSSMYSLDFSYDEKKKSLFNPKTWFGVKRKNADLAIWLLPSNLGTYSITTKVSSEKRETKIVRTNLGQFKGRNSRINKAVPIPGHEHGWRLDVNNKHLIKLINMGGDKGRCEGYDETSLSESGFTMFARVDNRDQFGNTRDAFVTCAIEFPLYRSSQIHKDGPTKSGKLKWNADEKFELPTQLVSKKIEIATFDGRSSIFTGRGSDARGFFSITEEAGLIILKPTPPRDL